jgi:hypothetical protein
MTNRIDPAELIKLNTPGVMIEMDWETAEKMGAFVEDALSEQDALESNDYL